MTSLSFWNRIDAIDSYSLSRSKTRFPNYYNRQRRKKKQKNKKEQGDGVPVPVFHDGFQWFPIPMVWFGFHFFGGGRGLIGQPHGPSRL